MAIKSFTSKKLLNTKVSSFTLLGLSLIGFSTSNALAIGDSTPATNVDWERCYGISKIGENDCSSLDGSHGCSGHAKTDNDPNEYIWVAAGTCNKIVNGVSYEVKKSRNIKKWCKKEIRKIESKKKARK